MAAPAARQAYRSLAKIWHTDRLVDHFMAQKLAPQKSTAINEASRQPSAFPSGTDAETHSGARSGEAEEARKRAAKESKAQEEAAGRARRAAEARAREEEIRKAAEARARERACLREETHRRAEEQARRSQARLKTLLYDDVVIALTGHEIRTNRVILPLVAIGRSLGFVRG